MKARSIAAALHNLADAFHELADAIENAPRPSKAPRPKSDRSSNGVIRQSASDAYRPAPPEA